MSTMADFFAGESLVPNRECGACVACCSRLKIDEPELQKPANVLCTHCTGSACGIHDARPQLCRDWFCAWRRIGAMPLETRPDKLGVMFDLCTPTPAQNILAKRYLRGFSLGSMENFQTPLVQQLIGMFRQARIPVWLEHDGRMQCIHPSQEIQQILLLGASPPTSELAAEAETWRKLYEPL